MHTCCTLANSELDVSIRSLNSITAIAANLQHPQRNCSYFTRWSAQEPQLQPSTPCILACCLLPYSIAIQNPATTSTPFAVLQFSVILLWFASLRRSGLCLDLAAISLPQWLAFLLLACYGQSLNVGIFQVCGCGV